jgi:hypothetical protein
MQRRHLLQVGTAAALLLGATGAGLALLRPGVRDGRFTAEARQVFAAVAAAVLDGLLPPEPGARAAALQAHLTRMDTTLAGLPPALQGEVAELATLLATAPTRLALTGLGAAWHEAPLADVQAMLQRLRLSPVALRQQVFHALRDLTNAAWFADASAWPAIGYPGPRAL